MTFKEAFRAARNAGKKTFTWNGKSYTTQTKEEADAIRNAPARPRARPNDTSPSSSPRPRANPRSTPKTASGGEARGRNSSPPPAQRSTEDPKGNTGRIISRPSGISQTAWNSLSSAEKAQAVSRVSSRRTPTRARTGGGETRGVLQQIRDRFGWNK